MNEKVILVYDSAVYDALRKQAKMNRRIKAFAVLVTAYIFLTMKERIEEQKKIKETAEDEKE